MQELLLRSEVTTSEFGQQFVFITFDLGVCMKALSIVWKFPDIYKNHIIVPGTFHTEMNYIGKITGQNCRSLAIQIFSLKSSLLPVLA